MQLLIHDEKTHYSRYFVNIIDILIGSSRNCVLSDPNIQVMKGHASCAF